MDTPPLEDFDTIIKEFNQTLSKMGPSLGAPVTRAESALLKTFYIWFISRAQKSGQDRTSHPLDDC